MITQGASMESDDCSQEITRVLILLARANLVIHRHEDGRSCLAASAAWTERPVWIDVPQAPSSPVIDAMVNEGLLAATTAHQPGTLALALTAEGRRRSRAGAECRPTNLSKSTLGRLSNSPVTGTATAR